MFKFGNESNYKTSKNEGLSFKEVSSIELLKNSDQINKQQVDLYELSSNLRTISTKKNEGHKFKIIPETDKTNEDKPKKYTSLSIGFNTNKGLNEKKENKSVETINLKLENQNIPNVEKFVQPKPIHRILTDNILVDEKNNNLEKEQNFIKPEKEITSDTQETTTKKLENTDDKWFLSDDSIDSSDDVEFEIYSEDTDEEINSNDFYQISENYFATNGCKKLIDCCTFSLFDVFLFEKSKILLTHQKHNKYNISKKITCNINPTQICSFAGYLHCLFNGKLYYLENSELDNEYWNWKLINKNQNKWTNSNINHISATLNEDFIWIQTQHKGFILNKNYFIIKEIVYKNKIFKNNIPSIRRVYGISLQNYVDIDIKNNKTTVGKSKEILEKIVDCVIDHNNNLYYITREMLSKYKSIHLVNWKPIYVMKK